jgi:hypothetical protein
MESVLLGTGSNMTAVQTSEAVSKQYDGVVDILDM